MAESTNVQRYERHTGGNAASRTFGLRLTLFLLVVGLVLIGLYISSGSAEAKPGTLAQTATAQVNPPEALQELRATEEAVLTTYGWVDRKNGVVHIPIDRAMDLLLQRGLPTRPPDQAPSQVF